MRNCVSGGSKNLEVDTESSGIQSSDSVLQHTHTRLHITLTTKKILENIEAATLLLLLSETPLY